MKIRKEILYSLYHAANEADEAWMEALREEFPHAHLGDVRYTERAKSSPRLRQLNAEFHRACDERRKAADLFKSVRS